VKKGVIEILQPSQPFLVIAAIKILEVDNQEACLLQVVWEDKVRWFRWGKL
jgi:hypothetical protein